jgi:diaminopimelate decarboxylase
MLYLIKQQLDAGMTDLLRPSLYGAQHPIITIPNKSSKATSSTTSYVVVGHCCESGDILTPASGT